MIDADRYFNDKESKLLKRPKCSCCNEHIQEETYIELPDGEILCISCEEENALDLWREWGRQNYEMRVEE